MPTLENYSQPTESHSCFCVGPQNGEPLCPCQMRNVVQINGEFYRVEKLKPQPERIATTVDLTNL